MKSNNKYKNTKQTKHTNHSKQTKSANQNNSVSLVYAIARLPVGSSEIDLDEGYVYNESGFRQFCINFDIKPLDYNDPLLLRHLADEFSNRCTPECEYDFSFQFVESGLIEAYQFVEAIREDAHNTVTDGLTKFAFERGCVCTCGCSAVEDS